MDLVNSHKRGVSRRNKVKKKKLQNVLRLALQEGAVCTTKSETNFSQQDDATKSKKSAKPRSPFIVTNKPKQKGKLLEKKVLKSDNIFLKEGFLSNCENLEKSSSSCNLELGYVGNGNFHSLDQTSGNNCPEKNEYVMVEDGLCNNNKKVILNPIDRTKIKSPKAQTTKKQCKKKGLFPILNQTSVINKKSTAESKVCIEYCEGSSGKIGKNNNRKKMTVCTENQCLPSVTVPAIIGIPSVIPNEKNANQTVQNLLIQYEKNNSTCPVNSNSKNKKVIKKKNLAVNAKEVVRKDAVEVPKINTDGEVKEEVYSFSCSDNFSDVPFKFSKTITEICSTDLDKNHQVEQKLNKDGVSGISDGCESGFENILPVCIEMDEDCIPSKFFGDASINNYSRSVKPLISGDYELFCRKLKNINKVQTEKWKIKVVDVNSSLCNNRVTNNKDKKKSKKLEETQEEVRDDDIADKGVTLQRGPQKKYFHCAISKNQELLVLPPGKTVNLRGIFKVKIILGSMKVLGYEMSRGETRTLYSPFGFTSLKLFNNFIGESEGVKEKDFLAKRKEYEKELNKALEEFKILRKVFREFSRFSTVIILENTAYSFLATFKKYVPEPIFRMSKTLSENIIDCIAADTFKSVKSNSKNMNKKVVMYGKDKLDGEEQWDRIANQLAAFGESNPEGLRFATFGGKGVGKSTFLRYIVNRMLSWKEKVLYIDLDLGQCEFTTPGCLSAVIIDKPLLGPSFTHLAQPARCVYLGEIQVVNQLTAYLECVNYIYEWCSSQEHLTHIPWCINTMGFPRGFGLEIAHYTINLTQPSHVVQINSGWEVNNFECLLNPDNVKEMKIKHINFNKNWDPQYHFYSIESAVEKNLEEDSIKTWPPYMLRNFAIVAYFNSVLSDANSLLSVVPHVIRFADIKLCVCHENINHSDYLNAMNANLVGLCNVGSGKGLLPSEPGYPEIWTGRPLGPCYGMGIVRGVDMSEKCIFLLTPLSREELNNVNCLVLGAVTIPSHMIFAQDEVEGEIPYVMKGSHQVLHDLGMQGKEWDG